MSYSRRDFLGSAFAAAALAALPRPALAAFQPLYPPMDLSYFDTAISAAPAEIKLGYAAITWNGNDRQAIEDIAALGFPGIQLRSNVLKEFPNPSELRDLLQQHRLTMVALSSGDVSVESDEASEIAKHAAHAKYAHDAGLLVKVWTVDDADDMRRLLSWGVDAIISDRPDVAVQLAPTTRR